jgi:hypothetical protein
MKLKDRELFKRFIHINYITGFLYAFYFYITSSKTTEMYTRRLWAYECWIILTLYGIFIWLFAMDSNNKIQQKQKGENAISLIIFIIVFLTFFIISKIT